MRESELENIAAVAESAATTRWREEAEDREGDQRQQNRVEAGDDGGAGDAGVAEDLRNVHRRERHARESVLQRRARLERKKPAKHVQSHHLAPARPPLPTGTT